MRGVFLVAALLVPDLLPAQLVRGRVLEIDGGVIPRAIVELRHPDGRVANRGTSGVNGNFALSAPAAGRYTLRVAAIGFTPHTGPAFDVPGAGVVYGDVTLARVAVTLAELQVLGTARCGSLQGGSAAMGRLLDGARTALDVMSAGISPGTGGFRVELVHRTALVTRRDSLITADTTTGALLRWPIESIDPDSIRKVGFMVRGPLEEGVGHFWFGPDIRVLFADWFLEGHCFRVAQRTADTAAIVVEFTPAERTDKVDIAGTLELDPTTLALRRLTFQHRNLPRAIRNGTAGGELQFAQLPSGLWLPMHWKLFAPILSEFNSLTIGISERSGRVVGVGREPEPDETPARRTRALNFRVPRETLTPPDSLADISRYFAALAAACPSPSAGDRAALFADERRLADAAARPGSTADEWHELACVRAWLDADEATGREGLRMPLGTGWQEGATNAWLEALDRDSVHLASAEGLAVLVLDQAVPRKEADVRGALVAAVLGGVTGPASVRACSRLTVRAGELAASNACVLVGLEAGGDSTWQLLHLARLAAHGADTLMVATLVDAALQAAHDPAAWSEVGWHLRWFTEPEEWQEWQELQSVARPGWVRDRLASRDVRDGRRPGARIVEHFRRLEHAEHEYLRNVPRRLRGFAALAANHDKGGRPIDPDAMRFTSWPERVPALTFREYIPEVEWIDDRGAVYLRFGAPSKSTIWIDTEPGSALVRESWLYGLDGNRLLVHFESEAFDGSNGPSRLVPGVLGHYLCALDAVRCQLHARLTCFEGKPFPGCDAADRASPLSQERVETLRTEDRSDIAIATTRDDNAPRSAHVIHAVAQFSRVWDPRSGAPLAVIPYAFRLGDVQRDTDSSGVTATLELTLRQWSSATGTWSSTDFQRRLRLAGSLHNDAHLTGYSVVPSATDVTAWSLFAAQGADRSGRAWGDRLAPLATGTLAMSDLVVGAEVQGLTWTTTGGTAVPLGPLGAFDRQQPVAVYWQVRTPAAREAVRISLALYRVGPRDTERPLLEQVFEAPLHAGLNELQRDIGLAELEGGTYRLEVTVRDGERSAVRSARVLLK